MQYLPVLVATYSGTVAPASDAHNRRALSQLHPDAAAAGGAQSAACRPGQIGFGTST